MNKQDKKRLNILIATINKNITNFYKIGCALREIRDSGLYLKLCSSFEIFCMEYLGICRSYAYRQIAASVVVDNVSPNGDIQLNEAHIRPLTKLEPSEQKLAWNYAVDQAKIKNRKLTSNDVNEAIKAITEENSKKTIKTNKISPPKKVDIVSKEFKKAYEIFFEEIMKALKNSSTERQIVLSVLKSLIKYVQSYS